MADIYEVCDWQGTWPDMKLGQKWRGPSRQRMRNSHSHPLNKMYVQSLRDRGEMPPVWYGGIDLLVADCYNNNIGKFIFVCPLIDRLHGRQYHLGFFQQHWQIYTSGSR